MAKTFMISTFNGLIQAVSLGDYHRYWLDKSAKRKNPAFDRHSGYILSLKEPNSRGRGQAIRYFSEQVSQHLSSTRLGVAQILIIPRAEAGEVSEGMEEVVKSVCKTDPRFSYVRNALRRHTSVAKLAHGGSRSMAVHLESIEYRSSVRAPLVKILLDDVATSGQSMAGCVALLHAHDISARMVQCLVLGRTADD